MTAAGLVPRAIACALFDIDGTLVDSNDAHAKAWVDAYAIFGKSVRFDAVRPLIGMGSDKLIEALAAGINPGSGAATELADTRRTLFLERYIGAVRPLPGARELVDALAAAGLTRIVASAASAAELEPLLRIADATGRFDHVVRSDDVDASKPDPDIIRAALDWAKITSDRAVMIGDTRFDIEAAHRADVRCIALRCGGSSDEELAGADAIFDTPRHLAAELRERHIDDLLMGTAAT